MKLCPRRASNSPATSRRRSSSCRSFQPRSWPVRKQIEAAKRLIEFLASPRAAEAIREQRHGAARGIEVAANGDRNAARRLFRGVPRCRLFESRRRLPRLGSHRSNSARRADTVNLQRLTRSVGFPRDFGAVQQVRWGCQRETKACLLPILLDAGRTKPGEPSGVNRIYRLYREEGLAVRKRRSRRKAVGTRTPILVEAKPNALVARLCP